MSLTRYQVRLINEIEDIKVELGLSIDRETIEMFEKEASSPILVHIKQFYIRSEVVSDYVFCDEMLNVIIRKHFFKNKTSGKKRKEFNDNVLEKMYLLQKLEWAGSFLKVPKKVNSDLRALNDIRNGMAHSFMPELRKRSRPQWGKQSIYEINNFKKYNEDIKKAHEYLLKKAFDV